MVSTKKIRLGLMALFVASIVVGAASQIVAQPQLDESGSSTIHDTRVLEIQLARERAMDVYIEFHRTHENPTVSDYWDMLAELAEVNSW